MASSMALEHHAAPAAVEVPLRCVVCGLPATSERRPPLCAGCQETPFSTPESKHSHRERFGPPEGWGHIYYTVATAIRSRGVDVTLTLALVWIPAGGTRHVTVGVDGDVLGEGVEINSYPWREVVLFPHHTMWLEPLPQRRDTPVSPTHRAAPDAAPTAPLGKEKHHDTEPPGRNSPGRKRCIPRGRNRTPGRTPRPS